MPLRRIRAQAETRSLVEGRTQDSGLVARAEVDHDVQVFEALHSW
jgi:hypothetical protein